MVEATAVSGRLTAKRARRPSFSLFFSLSSCSPRRIPSVRWFTSTVMLHFSSYTVESSSMVSSLSAQTSRVCRPSPNSC